jgi:UDP-N-acetylmuramoyl-tripeptide--D-alanyl-D-alanine ligase
MNLTLERIAEDLGSPLEGGSGSVRATGCSIDSRTIEPGQIFFAIRGPHFDGHDFVSAARSRGAVAAVVAHDYAVSEPELPFIRVESTTAALGRLARQIRKRWGRTVIGVTGSVGKTTTKEMVAALLDLRYGVHRSRGNLNNELGLPLSLTAVGDEHDLMVLEMGMSHGGEISRLAKIALPNEGVVTNVNPVHLEFFDSIDEIAAAKAELIQGLVGDKRAYLNADDHRVRAMANGFDGEVVTWGRSAEANFQIRQIVDDGLNGATFAIHHQGQEREFRSPLPGTHNVQNAAAAIAVAATHGVDWGAMRGAVSEFSTTGLRGVIRRYSEGFAVIDDSYNSNPAALESMIRLVGGMSGFRRRLLVAGEMLELGESAPDLHAQCGRTAVEAGFDLIIGVQGNARSLVDGARLEGARAEDLSFAENAEEAGRLVADRIRPGDLVLVKGSRGVHLEKVSEVLDRSFQRAES